MRGFSGDYRGWETSKRDNDRSATEGIRVIGWGGFSDRIQRDESTTVGECVLDSERIVREAWAVTGSLATGPGVVAFRLTTAVGGDSNVELQWSRIVAAA